MSDLAQTCESIAQEIGHYLYGHIKNNHGFQLRSFYGESFTLNLLARLGLLDTEVRSLLLEEYTKKDKSDSQFHHEFNNYAFSDYLKKNKDDEVAALFRPLTFKNTPCTNWTLLRSCVRLREKVDISIALKEVKEKIKSMQLPSGLILDDPGVKSFQYHCFSAAMLVEINDLHPDKEISDAFYRAVGFIRKFILDNGEALYIGRGQEQSFGLGVLVYILARAFKKGSDETLLLDIKKILGFIKGFKRPDGSYPLVFSGHEPTSPQDVDMMNEAFLGWYPYNNYFDYLPFLGYFLHKASLELKNAEVVNSFNPPVNYYDDSFMVIRERRYSAILSMPGGYWTNDAAMPIVFSRNKFLTPLNGGEQFQKSLYSMNDLSMPVAKYLNLSWRRWGRGFWVGRTMIWFSPFGLLKREFVFKDDRIEVKNKAFSWWPSAQHFSFLASAELADKKTIKSTGMQIRSSRSLAFKGHGYSCSGKLNIFTTALNVNLTMELD